MYYLLLYILPKNWLSRLTGRLVRLRLPFGLSGLVRDVFIARYRVDTGEAEFPPDHYATLGDFFVRRLRPGARKVADGPLVSPVDGRLTEWGRLQGPDLWMTQIKGIRYSFARLTRGFVDQEAYVGGIYATIYLAPCNYHRIHAPAGARLKRVVHIPGALWPVNTWSVRNVDGLFAANERVLVEMAAEQGDLVVVLVGATNVGRIALSFCRDIVSNAPGIRAPREWVPQAPLILEKGQELGCFEMGSTVVLLLDARLAASVSPAFPDVPGAPLRFGQELAR